MILLYHNKGVYPTKSCNNCKYLCSLLDCAQVYINQFIIKKIIDNNTIILGDFNTPLTTMDRSSKQKINKETMVLNYTLDQMDLTDIFRTFHTEAEKYTFL